MIYGFREKRLASSQVLYELRVKTDLRQVKFQMAFVGTDLRQVKCYMAFVQTDLRQIK